MRDMKPCKPCKRMVSYPLLRLTKKKRNGGPLLCLACTASRMVEIVILYGNGIRISFLSAVFIIKRMEFYDNVSDTRFHLSNQHFPFVISFSKKIWLSVIRKWNFFCLLRMIGNGFFKISQKRPTHRTVITPNMLLLSSLIVLKMRENVLFSKEMEL